MDAEGGSGIKMLRFFNRLILFATPFTSDSFGVNHPVPPASLSYSDIYLKLYFLAVLTSWLSQVRVNKLWTVTVTGGVQNPVL